MSAALDSFTRVRLIAGNTFLEAVRQKFFAVLLLIALGLVLSAGFFQSFDFGSGELKFIADFGFGGLFFFGSILAIVATAQLFFNEIENRTALTLLAKPVYKLEFLGGKLLGVLLLLLVFTATLTLTLAGILYWRESIMMQADGEAFAGGRIVDYADIFIFGLIQWIKFGIVSAITLFIASFANTNLYTMVVSFIVLVICQLQYIARDAYAHHLEGPASWLVYLLGLIFPNFQLFNIGDRMVFDSGDPLPAITLAGIAAYGLIYIPVFLFLSQLNFRNREI